MFKRLLWYFRYFRYCWKISKHAEVLEFFEALPEDDGRRYNLQLKQFRTKIPKAIKSGTLTKPMILRREFFQALNAQPEEGFADELSIPTLMMILWGMQRSQDLSEEGE